MLSISRGREFAVSDSDFLSHKFYVPLNSSCFFIRYTTSICPCSVRFSISNFPAVEFDTSGVWFAVLFRCNQCVDLVQSGQSASAGIL